MLLELLLAMQYGSSSPRSSRFATSARFASMGTMPDLPFPPLLLLPVLDAVAAAPGDGGSTLKVAQHEGRCALTLTRAGLNGNAEVTRWATRPR